jgi:hypothetical protein
VSLAFDKHLIKLGTYPEALRLHDLRGSHQAALLDRGIGLHVVAASCGHLPATLLKAYAKRTKNPTRPPRTCWER